jgi:hypothetical protein
MSAVQPRRLPLDRLETEHEQSPYVHVKVDRSEQHSRFINHFHRLGCTVNDRGAGIFDVRVTYPETVDDEAAAIAEWCASWSTVHPPSALVMGFPRFVDT